MRYLFLSFLFVFDDLSSIDEAPAVINTNPASHLCSLNSSIAGSTDVKFSVCTKRRAIEIKDQS